MPVGFAADWTTEALVTLLVAAVTHRVVQVPTRAGSAARRTRPAVSTNATILHPCMITYYYVKNCRFNASVTMTLIKRRKRQNFIYCIFAC